MLYNIISFLDEIVAGERAIWELEDINEELKKKQVKIDKLVGEVNSKDWTYKILDGYIMAPIRFRFNREDFESLLKKQGKSTTEDNMHKVLKSLEGNGIDASIDAHNHVQLEIEHIRGELKEDNEIKINELKEKLIGLKADRIYYKEEIGYSVEFLDSDLSNDHSAIAMQQYVDELNHAMGKMEEVESDIEYTESQIKELKEEL